MRVITITEAKKNLGALLSSAVAGEEIGIVSGADIIALRKVEVAAVDRVPISSSSSRLAEPPMPDYGSWVPDFPTFDGGPEDGAVNHDKYIYDEDK